MAYYEIITSKSHFRKFTRGGVESFDSLYKSDEFECGVSRWDTAHLYASRVICTKPQERLGLFSNGEFPDSAQDGHPCIARLIEGPAVGFRARNELQIIRHQQHQPDSLGYVWAALARLLQAETTVAMKTDRRKRDTQPRKHEGYVSSATMQVGGSSPVGSSSSSMASLDWFNKASPAPLEDLTVRLASCFIRCVVNYAQPTSKPFPILFRDERLTYVFSHTLEKHIEAVDDGGLQVYDGTQFSQVVTIEGKRCFQEFANEGQPTVSDKILGQLVGQALARRRARTSQSNNRNNVIIILAVVHYIKFFHFCFTDDFIDKYENPTGETEYLWVHSTTWFDINKRGHRKGVVGHVLALLTWADKQHDQDEDEPRGDEEESESDQSMDN